MITNSPTFLGGTPNKEIEEQTIIIVIYNFITFVFWLHLLYVQHFKIVTKYLDLFYNTNILIFLKEAKFFTGLTGRVWVYY